MSEPERKLEMLHDEGGWRVALWENLLLTGISKSPAATSLGQVRRGQRRLFEKTGAVGGLTLVVGLRLGPLDISEGMRAEIASMMNVPNLRGHSAIVIESEGFAAATIRAVLGALIVVSRPESPQKLFETRAEACRYLCTHAPGGWTATDLLDAAATFTNGLREA